MKISEVGSFCKKKQRQFHICQLWRLHHIQVSRSIKTAWSIWLQVLLDMLRPLHLSRQNTILAISPEMKKNSENLMHLNGYTLQ
jgi:hypothetical protein